MLLRPYRRRPAIGPNRASEPGDGLLDRSGTKAVMADPGRPQVVREIPERADNQQYVGVPAKEDHRARPVRQEPNQPCLIWIPSYSSRPPTRIHRSRQGNIVGVDQRLKNWPEPFCIMWCVRKANRCTHDSNMGPRWNLRRTFTPSPSEPAERSLCCARCVSVLNLEGDHGDGSTLALSSLHLEPPAWCLLSRW